MLSSKRNVIARSCVSVTGRRILIIVWGRFVGGILSRGFCPFPYGPTVGLSTPGGKRTK